MSLRCRALLAVALVAHGADRPREATEGRSAATVFCPVAGDESVCALLKPIRQQYDVPAISAAIVTSKGIAAAGAAGVRKRGTDIPVTLDDLWHLGSDTKAMTAALVAKLAEQGRLKWDMTVEEVFPELVRTFHTEMRGLTLPHLLSHRSGLPPNLDSPVGSGLMRFRVDDVRSERLRAVQAELARPPKQRPGAAYEYSNLGYIVAGAVVERITGKTWEDAIRAEVFTPLKMSSAGFGGTGTRGRIDQPWPHTSDGKPVRENGPEMDNPPIMGPAGRVHCTIRDWAKFIQDQLRGARGEPAMLTPASCQRLHTPPFGGNYALGWGVHEREWGGGKVLAHAGDNTMNYANVWLAPNRDFAILVCINQGGDAASKASDAAIGALIKLRQTASQTSSSESFRYRVARLIESNSAAFSLSPPVCASTLLR